MEMNCLIEIELIRWHCLKIQLKKRKNEIVKKEKKDVVETVK